MRFLADMGVDIRIVQWLNEHGHEAIHLRDEGFHRLPNGEIFGKAAREERILLTFGLDFGEIVALTHNRRLTPPSSAATSNPRFLLSRFRPAAPVLMEGALSI